MEQPAQPATPSLQIQRLYIKENHCKVPHAPGVFKEAWNPVTSLEMQVKHQLIEPLHHEVILQMSATAKIQERTAFQIDIQQAGVFKCEIADETTLARLVNVQGPMMLYPYLCRAIADAAIQAGFPPLLLTPIDFETMYQQQVQQATQQNKESAPNSSVAEPHTLKVEAVETVM